MISTRRFGRLGNEIFQVAMVIAYARKHGLEYSIPRSTNDQYWNPIHFPNLYNPKWVEGREDVLINENWNSEQQYYELEFKEEWRDLQVVLNGYFQSEKFFKEYREEILQTLGFDWEFNKGVIALHRRLGDYRKYPTKHPIISDEYISKSLSYFRDKGFTDFLIFSDEIDDCKQNINQNKFGNEYRFEYSEGKSEIEDLVLGSNCEGQIVSNSSFSWWQYWLNRNENKIGVFPKIWFGEGNSHLTTKDIYPENVVII